MTKKILIAFKPEMLSQLDYVAQAEHRTRSDLVREGMRRYLQTFKDTKFPDFSINASVSPISAVE